MARTQWQLPAFALPMALLLTLGQAAAAAPPSYLPPDPPGMPGPLPEVVPRPRPAPARDDQPGPFQRAVLDQSPLAPAIPPAAPAPADQTLPINLATALCLSNARPLVIAMAQNSVEEAAAQLQGANVLWLPNLNTGVNYIRHDGTEQTTQGPVIVDSKSSLMAGGGVTLDFGVTDAIFRPLAARQVLQAREWDVQAARNDAMASVAVAYFDVQEARGRLAGNLDSQVKAEELVRRIEGLARGLVPEIEVDRARTQLLELQQEIATSRAAWRIGSARLTRVLRLNPGAVVVPMEPPHLQVTLIPPGRAVDGLIPIGLKNRPELASQQALVRSTLQLLKQERLRPLIPSLVLRGGAGPNGALEGGVFGGGTNDAMDRWGGRFDADVSAVWTLYNLGAGNRSLVRQRAAQEQRAILEFFATEDRIAEEVVQAAAQLDAAATQVGQATAEVNEATITFLGTVKGLAETRGAGELLQLVSRPQEAVAALQQLNRAYVNYFAAANGYNRAQFQLYRALGYPARTLICDCPVGEVQTMDTSRPGMTPVCRHTLSDPCP